MLLDDDAIDEGLELVGGQALAALDDGEDLAGLHRIANTLLDLTDDTREARRDVGQAIAVRLEDAEQLHTEIDGAGRCRSERNAVPRHRLGVEANELLMVFLVLGTRPPGSLRSIGPRVAPAADGGAERNDEEYAYERHQCPPFSGAGRAVGGSPVRRMMSAAAPWYCLNVWRYWPRSSNSVRCASRTSRYRKSPRVYASRAPSYVRLASGTMRTRSAVACSKDTRSDS